MAQINGFLQELLDQVTAFLAAYPVIEAWYTTVVRFVFPILAVLILFKNKAWSRAWWHTPFIPALEKQGQVDF